jgi:predicted NAD-dependent protein-ADP-ribosyltransferase YbiA (DUF1768 family)
MKTLLQVNRLVLLPESEDEQVALSSWRARHNNVVFAQSPKATDGATLVALGPRADACREPINVTSRSPEPIRSIANFAPTPFMLDGAHYACVEAFWQALRFPPDERGRVAAVDGATAKRESARCPTARLSLTTGVHPVGTYEHWQLMRRACKAKFEQNENARAALLGTGIRPLVHLVRPDSRTIPGVVMADIWMKLRAELRRAAERKRS